MLRTSLVADDHHRRLPQQRDPVGSQGDDRRAAAARREPGEVPRAGASRSSTIRQSRCATARATAAPGRRVAARLPRRSRRSKPTSRSTTTRVTLPTMSTGATDMAHLRSKGMQCYGIGPALDSEDGPKGFGAHSDQERILESRAASFRPLPAGTWWSTVARRAGLGSMGTKGLGSGSRKAMNAIRFVMLSGASSLVLGLVPSASLRASAGGRAVRPGGRQRPRDGSGVRPRRRAPRRHPRRHDRGDRRRRRSPARASSTPPATSSRPASSTSTSTGSRRSRTG